jgi:hypothetical protein
VESIADQLSRLLKSSFYGERAEQTLIALYQAYEQATELAGSSFMVPEAHDLLPHLRRAFMEQNWRTKMKLLPGVIAESAKVKGGGNFYTKATYDQRLTLTVSSADAPWCLPRHAVFRVGYAAGVQLDLFEKPLEKVDGPFYAIITHGPATGDSELPLDFCQIGFPDNEYRSFVHRVNLLREYAPLFKRLHAGEEIVIGQATAELLENARKKNAS